MQGLGGLSAAQQLTTSLHICRCEFTQIYTHIYAIILHRFHLKQYVFLLGSSLPISVFDIQILTSKAGMSP